jgi:hypothetical protein
MDKRGRADNHNAGKDNTLVSLNYWQMHVCDGSEEESDKEDDIPPISNPWLIKTRVPEG